MWTDIFLASMWGGIVALDTTAVLQIMISRPIMACSIVGLILGNFPLGFMMGVLLEFLYISELPIGAAKFSESNVGSTAAATIAILTTKQLPDRPFTAIVFAIIVTVLISSFAGRLVLARRIINGKIYEKLLYRENLSPRHINMAQAGGIVMGFLLGFVSIFVSAAVFVHLLPILLEYVPPKYDKICQPAIGSVLALGCVFLIHLFWKQNQKKWVFFIGLGLGITLFIKYL